ncbi:MAG TPA: hypothetical protein VH372_00500, partial [Actinospica sp.]|nr:hypothetical protein [Actinospica sp.]
VPQPHAVGATPQGRRAFMMQEVISIPALSSRLRANPIVDELRRPGPGATVLAAAAVGILSSLALRSPMPFFLLPPSIAVLVVRRMHRRSWAEHDAQRDAITALCTALRAELEAGLQPRAAFVSAIWSQPELRDLAQEVSQPGADIELPTLLAEHATRPGRRALRALAACWFAAERHGLALADAVGGIEEGLRAEHSRLRAAEVELAGIRATILLLAALPALGLALGLALGADPLGTLLHHSVGQIGLVLGVVLDLAGLLWTDHLVAALRPEQSASRPRPVSA